MRRFLIIGVIFLLIIFIITKYIKIVIEFIKYIVRKVCRTFFNPGVENLFFTRKSNKSPNDYFQYKKEVEKYDQRILNFQTKLLEAEDLLLPVLHQGLTFISINLYNPKVFVKETRSQNSINHRIVALIYLPR